MAYVLIVEPDRALAETLQRYLAARHFKARAVSSAQDGIIQADQRTPDIVVLELAIPEHNGIEFLQEFRSYADWLKVPIVVYSHIPREDTGLSKADWQKYGVVGYLYKPTVGLERLARVLRGAVQDHETV